MWRGVKARLMYLTVLGVQVEISDSMYNGSRAPDVPAMQVEIREGWARDRVTAQRLPFDEDQWRRKFLRSIIGHLGKAQNVARVIKLTEHAMDGA